MTNNDLLQEELALEQFDLTKTKENELLLPESINESIVSLVIEIQGSSEQCNEYAQKAVTFLEQAESGIDKVNSNTGFFGKVWSAITGKKSIQLLENETMLANAQKACVQLILEMNKHYLLSQEQILMLQCQIKNVVVENSDFRRKLIAGLSNLFEAVNDRFCRIEKVMRDVVDEIEIVKTTQIKQDLQELCFEQYLKLAINDMSLQNTEFRNVCLEISKNTKMQNKVLALITDDGFIGLDTVGDKMNCHNLDS